MTNEEVEKLLSIKSHYTESEIWDMCQRDIVTPSIWFPYKMEAKLKKTRQEFISNGDDYYGRKYKPYSEYRPSVWSVSSLFILGFLLLLYAAKSLTLFVLYFTVFCTLFCIWIYRIHVKATYEAESKYQNDRAKNKLRIIDYEKPILAAIAKQKSEQLQNEKTLCSDRQNLLIRNMSWINLGYAEIVASARKADESYKKAVVEFDEGVFTLFWDAVEESLRQLHNIDQNSAKIATLTNEYHKTLNFDVNLIPQPFHANSVMPDLNQLSVNLQKITRTALKNFEFATIYEQRKTSSILKDGFLNLGDALHGLNTTVLTTTDGLRDSIDKLIVSNELNTDRLIDKLDSVGDAIHYAGDTVSARMTDLNRSVEASTDIVNADNAIRRKHDEKELKILDNIQRGNKPPSTTLEKAWHSKRPGDGKAHDVSAD